MARTNTCVAGVANMAATSNMGNIEHVPRNQRITCIPLQLRSTNHRPRNRVTSRAHDMRAARIRTFPPAFYGRPTSDSSGRVRHTRIPRLSPDRRTPPLPYCPCWLVRLVVCSAQPAQRNGRRQQWPYRGLRRRLPLASRTADKWPATRRQPQRQPQLRPGPP